MRFGCATLLAIRNCARAGATPLTGCTKPEQYESEVAPIMRFSLPAVLICIAASLWSQQAKAGLFFCNDTGEAVSVAVAWSEGNTWYARGWYNMEPRACTSTALLGALTNDRYWYYAESADLHWSGDGDSDAGDFCTSDQAFFFSNANRSDCVGYKFEKIFVGDAQQFTFTLSESRVDARSAALSCINAAQQGSDAFASCWIRQVSTSKQRRILDCIRNTDSKASLAICASKDDLSPEAYKAATCANEYAASRRGDLFLQCLANSQLSQQQAAVFNCAVIAHGDWNALADCGLRAGGVSEQNRKVFACVANNYNNYVNAGLCAASTTLSPEQKRVASCVLNNAGSYTQMAVCSVGNNLTPEQQAFASCAISTGGQPYAFVGCVGTQLTANELQKCLTIGVGGDNGCFGRNNTMVQFVNNAWKDVTKGPGPNNDLLGRDGFVGRKLADIGHDIQHGPGDNNDVVGKNGWLRKRLGF
jgi:uncharacterized membrane protein